MSTPLGEKIKALIKQSGPLSVADYFALCLADPDHGYYKTREPFGEKGDFTTAPEISQLFGEMLGIFMVDAWHKLGAPETFHLAEIGPGRGTMMRDMLRVVKTLSPKMYAAASIHLIETSDRLRAVQAKTLGSDAERVSWHTGFDRIPDGPVLLAANELFDAIPIRQFVKTPSGFRERMVSLDADDMLVFSPGVVTLDPGLLPGPADDKPTGTIVELAPARMSVMQALCERLVESGGVALIIDYGHTKSGYGDTLQALRAHQFDPPLAHPGEADLTSHVDFDDLVKAANFFDLHVAGLSNQGDFLLGLGLLERAGTLGANKDTATQDAIRAAVERLAGNAENQMGELFKVLAISNPVVDLEPFASNKDTA